MHLPRAIGWPASYSWHEIVNAVLHLVLNDSIWRGPLHDLPPYMYVVHHFRICMRMALGNYCMAKMRKRVLHQAGKAHKPADSIHYSQIWTHS